MTTIEAQNISNGEIIKLDGELLEVTKLRAVRHNPEYVRVEFSNSETTVLPKTFELETTGWKFR